jgi:hypothetical protein
LTDLVTRLQEAALASIEDLRPDLERDPSSVRGVTVEITVGPAGGLKDCVAFVEKRKSAGALMDRYAAGRAG